MSTMKLPANYASISEEEMVYLDGGARDAYNSFLNVGKVFNAIARIFSGASSIINSGKEDPVERIKEITGGEMAHQVMECSGANPAIRQTFDLVSNAGRITLTGWPKKETSLPTDVITKKEIDIRGARTSAGEFEEALDLINSRKVDMMKILTKTVTMDEAPDTIVDIEKNPGNYMKVVVRVSNDD